VIEEADGNRAIAVERVQGEGGALLFDLEPDATKNATGIAFAYKSAAEGITFDATVRGERPDGKAFFIDPNFRADHRALTLSDEWQYAYIPFTEFVLDQTAKNQVSRLGFFFFGALTQGEPILIDDIAFVYKEEDVVRLRADYTEAAVRPTSFFFSEEDLPAIREKIAGSTDLGQLWERYLKWVATFADLPTDPYTGWQMGEGASATWQGRILHSHVLGLAFVGLVEEKPEYIDKAIRILVSAMEQFPPDVMFNKARNALTVGDAALPLMIAYDWLNPHMSEEDRVFVKNRVHEYGAWIYTFSPTQGWGWDEPMRQGHNWNAVLHAPLGLAALILGDQPEWEKLANYQIEKNLVNSIDADGAPSESGHYLSLGSSSAYSYAIPLEREKGIDLLEPHLERLAGIEKYFANALLPWGGGAHGIVQGDAGPDKASWFLDLSNKLNSGLGYWIYLRYHGDKARYGGNGTWGVSSHPLHKANAPFIILAWDESIEPVSPAALDMPLSATFASGQAFARTGWGPEDAMFHFKSDARMGGWSHADDNNFGLIAHGASILSDPGTSHYHARFHNTYLIDGKGQAWITPGHDVVGKITDFEDHGTYVTLTGDATQSYAEFVTGDPHLPVEKVLRHALFLRSPEPLLVLVDELVMEGESEHDYTLLFQYGERHQPAEVVIESEADTIFSRSKDESVKAMTRILHAEAPLEIVERPDIKNGITTVAATARSTEGSFATVIIPVKSADTFPVIESNGSPKTGLDLSIDFHEHPPIRIRFENGQFTVASESSP
jgi:hypothetical protein